MPSRATRNVGTKRRSSLHRVNGRLAIGVVAAACILDATDQSGDGAAQRISVACRSTHLGRVGLTAFRDIIGGATTPLKSGGNENEQDAESKGLLDAHHCYNCFNSFVRWRVPVFESEITVRERDTA